MTAQIRDSISSFKPHARFDAETLILGSVPGLQSLSATEYYAHPRNAFWKLMQDIFNEQADTYDQKLELLTTRRVALWDVLASCERQGSLDSNIRSDSVVCNDFSSFLRQHIHIKKVLFNGKTAEKLFIRHVQSQLPADLYTYYSLPSTSPAMAMLNYEEKKVHWLKALN